MKVAHAVVTAGLALLVAYPVAAQQRAPWYGVVPEGSAWLPPDTRLNERLASHAPARHAFALLRTAAATHEDATRARARAALDALTKDAATTGWGHYGLGILEAVGATNPVSYRAATATANTARFLAGDSPPQRARERFRRALAADPSLDVAAVALAHLALLTREQEALREARTKLAALPVARPEVLHALTEVANALGELATTRNVALPDGCRDPLLMRTAAEAALRTPGSERSGALLYRRAVDCMDDPSAGRFFADVRLLLTPAERAAWQDGTLEQRRALLKDVWTWRAAHAGVTEHERMAEHYRRLAHVHEWFYRWPPGVSARAHKGFQVVSRDRPEVAMTFDERAALWLRHGPPDREVGAVEMPDFASPAPTEGFVSWVYSINGEQLLFHFRGASGSFMLGETPSCSRWLEALASVHVRLGLLDARCRSGSRMTRSLIPQQLNELNRELRDVYTFALTTDTHRPFREHLPFYYDLYRLAAADGRTDLVSALAVPAAQLDAEESRDGGFAYSIAASLIVLDTVRRTVTRMDTTLTVVSPRPLGRRDLVRAHLQLTLPPSSTTLYRVMLRSARERQKGAGYGGPLEITDYRGDELAMSDLVLAQATDDGTWRRGAARLALVPFKEFPGGEFNLFYELYNVPPDARLHTRVTLKRERSALGNLLNRDRPVELSFTDLVVPSEHGVAQQLRRLQSGAEPGEYTLTVHVRDLDSGADVRRERSFIIVPPPATAATPSR